MSEEIRIPGISQRRRLWILRVSMLIAFVSYSSYLLLHAVYDFQLFLPVTISILIYLVINAGAFILLRYRKYLLAIHLYSSSLILEMVFLTFFIFGKDPGVHFYFILFAFVPLPFFPLKKTAYALLYFVVSFACFLYVEFFDPAALIEYPQDLILPVKVSSIVFSIGITMFLFSLYYRMSEKSEQELEEAKKDLESKNDQLSESIAEIEAQKQHLSFLNESLTEADRTKNLFFSIISHDLKNPLSSLVGLLDLLEKYLDTYDRDEIKEMISTIALSANNLQDLVFDLLEWSRTQTGRIQSKFTPCVVKDLLLAEEALCRDMIQQKDIKFRYSITSETVFETDKSLLSTILRNLFTNAIKYSHPGGEIIVSVTENEGKVVIGINDNGVGMTKEVAANLFKIDKIQTTPGTNRESGTGLGLIISYEFVKILKGTIEVISSKGEGSEFLISLPIDNTN